MLSTKQRQTTGCASTSRSLPSTAKMVTVLPPSQSSPNYHYFRHTFIALFISALISCLATIVGPFAGTAYRGTQIIPHPMATTGDGLAANVVTPGGDRSYAIVMDGGSTGTRVHIFSFTTQINGKTRRIFLESETFQSIKPGLSSYADSPTDAAVNLQPLLDRALAAVPDHHELHTGLILKATAGLRLIPKLSADTILESVRQKLESTPFRVDDNSVSILDDRDEGLYAWYTVNFLLSKLHDIHTSIVTLDLGGGSTQITFATNTTETLVRSPNGYIVKEDIEGEPEYLYTHSYLGFGLMSARKRILLASGRVRPLTDTHILVSSPCFATTPNRTEKWTFEGVTYEIAADEDSVLSGTAFDDCYDLSRQLVATAVHKPEELRDREVFGLSYYYDRMNDVRLVKDKTGRVKVRDYYSTAENVCQSVVKLRKQSPFLCLDMTYITAFLRDGLGLDWQKDIT
ncbi:unnamed protein product, partial [Medioppia subpectinata]